MDTRLKTIAENYGAEEQFVQPASECNNRKSVIRKVEYGGVGKWL